MHKQSGCQIQRRRSLVTLKNFTVGFIALPPGRNCRRWPPTSGRRQFGWRRRHPPPGGWRPPRHAPLAVAAARPGLSLSGPLRSGPKTFPVRPRSGPSPPGGRLRSRSLIREKVEFHLRLHGSVSRRNRPRWPPTSGRRQFRLAASLAAARLAEAKPRQLAQPVFVRLSAFAEASARQAANYDAAGSHRCRDGGDWGSAATCATRRWR